MPRSDAAMVLTKKRRRRRALRSAARRERGEPKALPLTLIFDFDGTIADTLETVIRIINDHAEEFRIAPLAPADVDKIRGMTNRDILRASKIPRTKIPAFVARTQRELHRRMDGIRLVPGVKDLVLSLKRDGVRLGILTSNSRPNVFRFLRARGLDVFDFVHSESNLFGKRRALGHLLKTRRLKRSEVLYVGDEVRDVEACRKARVPMIAVAWGFHRKDLLARSSPDFLVDEPGEITAVVSAWKDRSVNGHVKNL